MVEKVVVVDREFKLDAWSWEESGQRSWVLGRSKKLHAFLKYKQEKTVETSKMQQFWGVIIATTPLMLPWILNSLNMNAKK